MDARIVKSEVRQRLAQVVRGEPGLIITELGTRMGLSHSTVSYHLRILENAGEIQSKRDGRIVRYYAQGQYDDMATRLRPLLQRARVVAIIKLIQEKPDVCPFNIAQELNVSVPTVMWHLGKLRDYGAISMEKRNGQYDITLSPSLQGLV
ncbi:MAG: winged helix-turn-helix transcriptional regulator [Halobacteriales archaeon]|nr:winged helix-turn-helix transcriptional regulator [Halobacteriales archaeon]